MTFPHHNYKNHAEFNYTWPVTFTRENPTWLDGQERLEQYFLVLEVLLSCIFFKEQKFQSKLSSPTKKGPVLKTEPDKWVLKVHKPLNSQEHHGGIQVTLKL